MQWDESFVMGALLLLLLACELAACMALAVLLVRAASAWARRKRRETLGRARGFEVKLTEAGDEPTRRDIP